MSRGTYQHLSNAGLWSQAAAVAKFLGERALIWIGSQVVEFEVTGYGAGASRMREMHARL